jgi:hypothetical protein
MGGWMAARMHMYIYAWVHVCVRLWVMYMCILIYACVQAWHMDVHSSFNMYCTAVVWNEILTCTVHCVYKILWSSFYRAGAPFERATMIKFVLITTLQFA